MDKETFVREMEAYGGMLYRVAYTILRNNDACRDALQETALRAWEKRFSLRESRYFRTWVTRILIHICCDMRRKSRRLVSMEAIAQQAVPAPDPVLAIALHSLPEKLRLPLVLSCCERMTYAEIAQVLRLPVSTVRGRIHRAKEALRKELDVR